MHCTFIQSSKYKTKFLLKYLQVKIFLLLSCSISTRLWQTCCRGRHCSAKFRSSVRIRECSWLDWLTSFASMNKTSALIWSSWKRDKKKCVPSKAQKLTHEIQVFVYKTLFNDFIRGNVSKSDVIKHFPLDFSKQLGSGIRNMLSEAGLSHCKSLDELWISVTDRCKAVPCISRTLIEYCHQTDQSTIAIEEVTSSKLITDKIHDLLQFWNGKRQVSIIITSLHTYLELLFKE